MSEDAAERDATDGGGSVATDDEPETTSVDGASSGAGGDGGATGAVAGSADTNGDADDASDDLAARVADHDEALADEVRDLQAELAEREERIDELESKLKRKVADFENYKKRAERRREEIKERATEDLVERVVDVRDDLVRALDQDDDSGLRDGIASTLDTFDRVLAEENVEPIEPDPGEEVDPHRHEVLMRVASDRPEGRIVDRYRPGYEMAGTVLQTAQVTVSEGDGDATPDDGADA